jgi:hypothetical protein
LIDMTMGGKSTASMLSYVKGNLQALRSRRIWLRAGYLDAALVSKPLRKLGQFLPR